MVLEQGQAFRVGELARQRQALSASGLFREVRIDTLPAEGESPRVVPLKVHFELFKSNRFRGRVAWGTDTEFGAQLGWTRRYAGKRGQHFNLGLGAVQFRNKIAADLNYVIPLDPLQDSHARLGARHESKDLTYQDVGLDEGGETRIETELFGGTWQRPQFNLGAYRVTPEIGINLVQEQYDVFEVLFGHRSAEDQEILIGVIGEEAYDTLTPDFTALVPGLRMTLRREDDPVYIGNGEYLRLDLLGTDQALGSNIDFWQFRMEGWFIRSPWAGGRILSRLNAGYSDADSREVLLVNFNLMPEYYEFRAGGARSVRGYGYERLIPDDTITGGKNELVASLEYEHTVMPDWSVAAFVDAGNAFNSWDDYDPKVGVGLGVRWRSPVGLARIDLGIPLDDAEDEFQIYITVGPEF